MAVSKPNTPWSVKGIEREARETAKEAATREGMTVGAWLNQIIYSSANPRASTGVVDGIEMRDVVVAIEALNKRLADEEGKSAVAIDHLSRTFGGVVERLQRLERGGQAGVAADLADRVERLEAKTADRQRIDALRSLERAVSQVALQFDATRRESISRLDEHEERLKLVAARIEEIKAGGGDTSAVDYLKNAVDGLAARTARAERIAAEAAKLRGEAAAGGDAEFVERTGEKLRVLGDEIKRGGDQIRSLERTIMKLSAQIDAAERRSAEGVEKVSETIIDIRRQFEAADAAERAQDHEAIEQAIAEVSERTDARLDALQSSFDEVLARFESGAGTSHAAALRSSPGPALTALHETNFDDEDLGEDEDEDAEFSGSAAAAGDIFADTNGRPTAVEAVETEEEFADFADFEDPFADDDVSESVSEAPGNRDVPVAAARADADRDVLDDFTAPSAAFGGAALSASLDLKPHASVGPAGLAGSAGFDDEEDEDVAVGSSGPSDDILSQVRLSVGEQIKKATAASTAGSRHASDLDAVLAELEGMGFRDEAAPPRTRSVSDFPADAFDEGDAAPAAPPLADEFGALPPRQFAADPFGDDFGDELDADAHDDGGHGDEPPPISMSELPRAGQPTRMDRAEAESDGERPITKRQLTPKQRAILAARLRRKRLAEAEAQASVPTSEPAAQETIEPAFTPADLEKAPKSLAGRLSGALAALTNRRRDDNGDARDEAASDDDDDGDLFRDGDAKTVDKKTPRAAKPSPSATAAGSAGAPDDLYDFGDDEDEDASSTHRGGALSGLLARPAPLAIGAASMLVIGAAAFLMRDSFIPGAKDPSPKTAVADAASPAAVTAGVSAPEAAQTTEQDPRTTYYLGVEALKNAASLDEESAAIALLRDAAERGHAPAQLQLGELHKTGQGVDRDLSEARRWYERAAASGNVLAMHRVGVMAAQGEGGPLDVDLAIANFEAAANRALVDAQYNLGAIFHPNAEETVGGLQSAEKAYYWYALAARNGDDQAASLAAGLAASISAERRAEIDAQVAAWQETPGDPAANEIAPAS